jgi:hypothetical protein
LTAMGMPLASSRMPDPLTSAAREPASGIEHRRPKPVGTDGLSSRRRALWGEQVQVQTFEPTGIEVEEYRVVEQNVINGMGLTSLKPSYDA